MFTSNCYIEEEEFVINLVITVDCIIHISILLYYLKFKILDN